MKRIFSLALAALMLLTPESYAATVNMLMPGAGAQYCAKSGTCYTPNANKIVASAYGDVTSLLTQGGLMLGQSGGVSNWTATTNPTTSNDSTQGYAIGSHWLNKSTGVEYVCSSATASAAVWSALDAAGFPGLPWVTGQFYGVPRGVTPVAFLTVASVLYAYPIFVPNTVTISAEQVSVTTGQTGGKVEIGIYKDTGAGYPGALVAGTDTGDLDGTATAVVGPTNLAVVLTPGYYWLAVQAAASSTMPSVAGMTVAYASETTNQLGSDTAAHLLAAGSEAVMGIKKTSLTYAPLLTTFPASAALVLNAGVPLVSLGD